MRPWSDGRMVPASWCCQTVAGSAAAACGTRIPATLSPSSGCTLLARDPGPFDWDHRWVRWPDFRTPASTSDAIATLVEAYERSATERIEIACGGGFGRTGTALAAIAVLAGVPRDDAVAWVRGRYDPRAVDTPWQRRWVRRLERPA